MAEKNKNQDDIHDKPEDEAKLKPEETVIDLPDVEDIPGQENIVPPRLEGLNDVTIASDGEEGVGLFDEEDDEQ